MNSLDCYIDRFLKCYSSSNRRLLYTAIASIELGLRMNYIYLYDDTNVYICSANQVLNLSQRLEFELRELGTTPILIVPSYTRVSRDVIARVRDVIRFDVSKSYFDYINARRGIN